MNAQGSGREPELFFPGLAPFYDMVRDLSWPVIRVTVGGLFLTHGIIKLTHLTPAVFAKVLLVPHGIEPALLLAYFVFLLETVGAVCIIVGLLTRPIAAAAAIELLVVTFVIHFANGFAFSSPRGGWEYPLMWGLMFFAISLRGGGPYSLDRKIGKEV